MRHGFLLLATTFLLSQPSGAPAGDVLFYPVDIYVDSGERALAAWQFEVLYDEADISIVGIEGGDRPFEEAPYYDPAGMTAGRIVIAAFSTDDALPDGRVRVARLHLMEEGDGDGRLRVRLIVSAGRDGGAYDAAIDAVRERGERHE